MLLFVLLVLIVSKASSPLENAPFNIVGKGWQSFKYGERNTEIHDAFTVVSSAPVILRITDTSKPGAAFRVYDGEERILTTPIPAIEHLVRAPTLNPLRAYNSVAWSHGHVVLPSGFHHIRVTMRFSPWAGGTGAILAEPGEKCTCPGSERFFLVLNQVDWDSADKLCKAYGGRLAKLHAFKSLPKKQAKLLKEAFQVVHACKPDNGMAWIKGKRSLRTGEDEFPSSIKAISDHEGITGAEWEISQLSTLCQYN